MCALNEVKGMELNMKEKIKLFSRKYLIGFTIGAILFGSLGVYAATYFPSNQTTYDNTDSGMTATNVQDALDELYTVCVPPKAADQIIENAGLEKDPYECRYFFTGNVSKVNNHISFNQEQDGNGAWRIVSVECDGTIKIKRHYYINESMDWDSSGSNNWARPATLNTYLNETYLNSLSSEAQKQIVSHNWSIGKITPSNKNLNRQIINENSKTWKGKIALLTPSEIIRTNSNKEQCGTYGDIDEQYSLCKQTTWITPGRAHMLLTPIKNENHVSYISNAGYLGAVEPNGFNTRYDIVPALYLSSDIKITGGDGSWSNPYTISM